MKSSAIEERTKIALTVEVELGEPQSHPLARWATLRMHGIEIFTYFVYDCDKDGNRSDEQAVENLMKVFASRLRGAMDHANGD